MRAHPRVITYLQRSLAHEFSAAQQYTLQAVRASALGLGEFAVFLRGDAHEELEHAEAFASRLVALGVTPQAAAMRMRPVGRTQEELLRFGMDTETAAMQLYGEAALFCERIADLENAALFQRIRNDEVAHFRHLEQLTTGARPQGRG